MLRFALTLALAAAACLPVAGGNAFESPNVNSRYTVESVHVSGKRTSRLSAATRQVMEGVVGRKLDHGILEDIATRIKRELRVEGVAIRVAKGTSREQVAVEFAVENGRRRDFDVEASKGVYSSKQGWSGGVTTTTSFGANDIGLGVISDGDSSVERFAGLRARYERNSLGTDRLRLRVDFDSYHEQWNDSTIQAGSRSHFSPDLYRTRQNIEPSLTIVIAQPLTLTVGMSFERLEPAAASANAISANALVDSLRLHERWDGAVGTQDVDAAYTMRAGTGLLGSDAAYVRQSWTLSYRLTRGNNTMSLDLLAGRVTGNAPLYERFVLGNGSTLRGWNKYDLDPLGGDRAMHASAGYSYRHFQAFYDTGAIWDRGTQAVRRQSAGVGFGKTGKDGFLLAMALPIRSGHIEPMFIAGFNF